MEIGIRIGKQTWTLKTELESMELEYRIGIWNWIMEQAGLSRAHPG